VIKNATGRLTRNSRRLWARIKKLLADALRCVKAGWARHREQVSTNPAYATALGAAATAVVELFTHDPKLLAVVAALVALYVAIHRAGSPDPWTSDQARWSDGLDCR
jgi:hypothetical protein